MTSGWNVLKSHWKPDIGPSYKALQINAQVTCMVFRSPLFRSFWSSINQTKPKPNGTFYLIHVKTPDKIGQTPKY